MPENSIWNDFSVNRTELAVADSARPGAECDKHETRQTMASRDNQGQVIALTVFVLFTVVFAIATYYFLTKYDEASKQVADLQSRMRTVQNTNSQVQEEINTIKEMMGFSPDDNLATIQEGHKLDMEAYAAAYLEDEKSYRKLVEAQASEISAIGRRELDSQQRERELQDNLVALQAEMTGKVDEYVGQLDKATVDVEGLRNNFATERTRITTDQEKLAGELQGRDTTILELQTSAKEAEQQMMKKESDFNLQITKQQNLLDQYQTESFEKADGTIVNASQLSKKVWIDLGRADALVKQVTFSVYGVDENDAAKAKKKGTIEVMRILDAHLAEARITSDGVFDPILPQDKIYSPVWQRGRRESFALAGFIDIDGDGKADNARVRDLIERNGGVVDAESRDDGTVTGEMTINTRFLVLGEAPTIGDSGTSSNTEKALDGYSEMQSRADSLGVATINVHQFLDHMGWRPDDQTLVLRRGDNPPSRRAEASNVGESGPFRPRRPTYIKY